MTLSSGPRSLLDADGAALVVHSGPDDFRSDPAGVSGSRVACGVIVSRPGGDPEPTIMTDIRSILLPVTEPADLAGRRVELTNIEVRAVAGKGAVWVGAPGQELLVVADDRRVAEAIGEIDPKTGERITVAGILDVVPRGDSTLARQWGLGERDAAKTAARRVFVRASRLAAAR